MGTTGMQRWRSLSVLVLTLTAIYLFAFPSATIFYAANVILHMGLGVLVSIGLLIFFFRGIGTETILAKLGWMFLFAGALAGIALIRLGTAHRFKTWLYAHIALCVVAVFFLAAAWLSKKRWLGHGHLQPALRLLFLIAATGGISAGAWWAREYAGKDRYKVNNPQISPATMEQEGDGPHGKFFPSSVQTTDGNYIPSDYFLQSQACERCHGDIYKQWDSSAHHFSSFNNQWYRKSIEYMQDVNGVTPSKWCAGCHDPALLFSGMMDQPIKQNINKPEAKAGLSCLMCHSIVKVKGTMGQGDFTLEYPALHALAASKNPYIRGLHDFMVRLNPEPHRRVFLKPR